MTNGGFYKEPGVLAGDVFSVRYLENGEWVDVFPGLTGSYEWAQGVKVCTWERNGRRIRPNMMRIYAV